MKNMIFGLIMIILGACSLDENIKKEEEKDYTDVVHPVDMADYEFEQRLNSFYESEPIKNEELYGLYKGEFPDGERNPQKLRIHWKDARELALAELELQRPLHSGWEEGDISERPVLRLDRDGGDFYRYYEYRVVKGLKFLGAIRIPAYRRTENFATAEVHRYSDDEKTYTIHPNGWGKYIAENSSLEAGSSFYSSMLGDLFLLLQNKNFGFNWYYRSFQYQNMINNTTPITTNKSYWLAYDKMSEMIRKVDLPHSKTSIGEEHLNFMASAIAQDKQQNIADTMTEAFRFYSTAQTIADITDTYDSSYLSGIYMNAYIKIYKKAVDYILDTMSKSKYRNILQKSLHEIYWDTLDPIIKENSLAVERNTISYLDMSWDLGEQLVNKQIYPKIDYPSIGIYPSYRENQVNPALRYKYVTAIDFKKGQNVRFSFITKDKASKVTFDNENIPYGLFTAYLESTDPKNNITKQSFNVSSRSDSTDNSILQRSSAVSHSEIESAVHQIYELVKDDFADKTEQQLKSEIAGIIYAQADFYDVYYDKYTIDNTRNRSYPDKTLDDILDNLIDKMNDDNLLVNKNTIGIWMASGIAFNYMEDEINYINNNMEKLTELYNWLANDYVNVLNQVYEKAFAENGGDAAAAKAARDKFQGQLKLLESIVREKDAAQGVKHAMKLMVKKWLVWYIPIFPWPMGHWRTYSTENIKGDLTTMEIYADPIDDLTLPLALAVSWIEMDQLPVSRPSDVDENLFPQKDIPESVKKNNLESEWMQAVIWFDEQDIVQKNNNGKFDEDKVRDLYELFTDNITLILGSPKVYGNDNDPEHNTEEFVSQFTNRERRLELERWLNNWMYINNDPKNTEIIPCGGYWRTGGRRAKRTSISRHIDYVYRYGSYYVPEFLKPYDYTPFKLTN